MGYDSILFSSYLCLTFVLLKHMKTGPPSALSPFQTRYDEYMSEHYPHHYWYSLSPEKLKAFFKTMGATDDNLQEYLEWYNKRWDEMIANSPNGRLLMVGVCSLHLLPFGGMLTIFVFVKLGETTI